jgi:hypothetical protein
MSNYKTIFRDAAGADRMAFTAFDDNETIEENLSHVLPMAIERGLLHSNATIRNVKVEYRGKDLNLKLPVKQAAPGIKPDDEILIRYISSSVNLYMHIQPDDPEDMRKIFFGRRKTFTIKETVPVSPSEPLGNQIKEKLEEIRGKYRFSGREIKDVKKFDLRASGKKLRPNMNLADQGIETDFEARVRPRIWCEWPPCFFNGLAGPYTGYGIALGIILLIIMPFIWRTSVDEFSVTFEAPFEFNIKIDGAKEYVGREEDRVVAHNVSAGEHTVHVYPRELPIQSMQMEFKKNVIGRVSDSDRILAVPLELAVSAAPMDTAAADSAAADSTVMSGGDRALVRISGYEGNSLHQLRVPLLFNGFEYSTSNMMSWWEFRLIPGEYEFKLKLKDEEFTSSEASKDGAVVKKSDFRFAVTDTTEATITFRYNTEEK